MKGIYKSIYLALICLIGTLSIDAETLPDLHRPLDIPLVLSGNFGELRNNHFHSGLDFKTQGRTGFKIYCADDGYVSRVLVSPWGFGRAIYVIHPATGLTTVYGHLESFSTKIDKVIKQEQYRREEFRVDMNFAPGEIPVKKGEVIARSGNSGSSGGPHLHMDVRETATENPIDPMPYFKQYITDNVAPQIRSIALYSDGGVIDSCQNVAYRLPAQFAKPIEAWGRVIPGIKAYDKMTGVNNIYGVKYLTLTVDGKHVYQRVIERFSFDDTRAVHTLINFPDKVNKSSWIMVTKVPKSVPLGAMIETDENNGVLIIDEERDYNCRFVLQDEHGNKSSVKFVIRGKKTELPELHKKGTLFRYNGLNTYNMNGIKVVLQPGTFYDDVYFNVASSNNSKYVSAIHSVGSVEIPLHKKFDMEIAIERDTLVDKNKYCLVRLNGKRQSAVSAIYKNGKMTAEVNRFGKYAVTTDETKPEITPQRPDRWAKRGKVSYKITDKLSGVASYRGEIDGKFVLFEFDGKTGTVSYKLEQSRVKKGRKHTVKMTVTDGCGNTATKHSTFTW